MKKRILKRKENQRSEGWESLLLQISTSCVRHDTDYTPLTDNRLDIYFASFSKTTALDIHHHQQ
ncbi:hypothetical protein CDAR_83871, partial [Caerostris darwini]